MSEILENLFGGRERARILRFFLQNPEQAYEFNEVVKRNMLRGSGVKGELMTLSGIKFIHRRTKKGKVFYQLNQNFDFYPELKNLIAKSNVYPQCKSLGNISKLGNVKLAVISGAFLSYHKSKADMILVGDGISKAKLKNLMSRLEAEIGKEINFVLMTADEFKYRLNMLDKFILEFLEGPHEEIVNKVPGLKQFMAKRK